MNTAQEGTYTGTGAAINIELGFLPDYIRVWNVTDGDICWEWFSGMTNGHACQTTNHASTQLSRITSNGISHYNPTDYTNSPGFTVGTALSESGKAFYYVAIRNTQ